MDYAADLELEMDQFDDRILLRLRNRMSGMLVSGMLVSVCF